MARSYAKLFVSLWDDDDFLALTEQAQRLYMMLLSNPKLSPAGCLPVQTTKWSNMSMNGDPQTVRDALADLVAARFVLVDERTEEAVLRKFIFHDGGWRNPNLRKSIVAAIAVIESRPLRAHAAAELDNTQVTDSEPDCPAEPPDALADAVPNDVPNVDANAIPDLLGDLTASSKQQARTESFTQQQQQQPPASGSASLHVVPEHDAAAAAIEAFIAFKITKDGVTSPVRLQSKLRADVPGEYGAALTAYLRRKPATDERELLRRVFLLNPANTEKALSEARKMSEVA